MPILLVFFGYVALEIYVLSRVWDAFGFFNTFFALLFAAVIGIGIVRNQGRYILAKMQHSMAQGQPPTREVLHGVLLLVGGLLFIVPGFVSHAIAILFVLPGTRHLLAAFIGRRLKKGMARNMNNGMANGSFGNFRVFTFGSHIFSPGPKAGPFARPEHSEPQVRDVTPLVIDVKNVLRPEDKD